MAPLLPEFDSPAVATAAEFVIDAGALDEILACKVIVEVVPAAMAVLRVHVTVAPTVQVQFAPEAEVTVRPVGIISWTVIVPVVGPLPPFVMVMS